MAGKHIFADRKLTAIHAVDQLAKIIEQKAVVLDLKHHAVRIEHGVHVQPRRKEVEAALDGNNAAVKGNAYFVLLGDKCLAVVFYDRFGAIAPAVHQRVALRGKRLRIPQQRRVVAARERLGILPCHAQRALELTCALLLLHLQHGEVCRRIVAAQAQLAPQLHARCLFAEVPVVERIEVK